MPKRSRIQITEEKIQRTGKLAGLGLSNDQIAECLDMSRSSFSKCMQKNADFIDSLERGVGRLGLELRAT